MYRAGAGRSWARAACAAVGRACHFRSTLRRGARVVENSDLNAIGRLNIPPELLDEPGEHDIDVEPGTGPFSPDERRQVVKWIAAGHSRNQLVKRTGRGGATITRIAQAAGLKFTGAQMLTTAHE